MWFIFIIIILLPANGYGRMCVTNPDIFCHTPSLNPSVIPRNEDELRRLCPKVSDNLECLHSYDVACRGRSRYIALPGPLDYKKMKSFVDDACDIRREFHRLLNLHLSCIKSRTEARDSICSKSRKKVLDAYEEYYLTHSAYRRKVQGPAKRDRMDCLHNVYTTGCILKDIERECGYSVYEVGMSLIGTNILVDNCGREEFQDLADIVEDNLMVDGKSKAILKEMFTIYI